MVNKFVITYLFGGAERLDEVQPLWEGLNRHHADVSPHFGAEFQEKTFSGRKNRLMEKYADGEMRIDFAQTEGRHIGYVISAVCADGAGEIESIYVDDEFRGQAIGEALMERALGWLEERGVQSIVIAVAVGNERAFPFYARFGFAPRVVMLSKVN